MNQLITNIFSILVEYFSKHELNALLLALATALMFFGIYISGKEFKGEDKYYYKSILWISISLIGVYVLTVLVGVVNSEFVSVLFKAYVWIVVTVLVTYVSAIMLTGIYFVITDKDKRKVALINMTTSVILIIPLYVLYISNSLL